MEIVLFYVMICFLCVQSVHPFFPSKRSYIHQTLADISRHITIENQDLMNVVKVCLENEVNQVMLRKKLNILDENRQYACFFKNILIYRLIKEYRHRPKCISIFKFHDFLTFVDYFLKVFKRWRLILIFGILKT